MKAFSNRLSQPSIFTTHPHATMAMALVLLMVSALAPRPVAAQLGAPPLRPENLVGLKALAEEHDLEFPWEEWEALLEAAADDSALLRVIDRDGDGYADGYEIAQGTDPLDPDSRPALGDVNDDGVTNNLDAVALFHHLLGQYDGPFDADRADVRQDGEVRNTDAVTLFNWLLGAVPFLPFPEGIHLVRQDGTGHFTTIQSAIDVATTGSTVLVYPGTYYENLVMPGRDIVLTSTDPFSTPTVAATVIDGASSGSVVTFSGTETSQSGLYGFSITNGQAILGAGINGNGTKASIGYCNISNNAAIALHYPDHSFGGGIYGCDGYIYKNDIHRNKILSFWHHMFMYGGGGLFDCNGIIRSNNINVNGGGGVVSCQAIIDGNVISGNFINGIRSNNCVLLNNIICRNMFIFNGGVYTDNSILVGNIIAYNFNDDEPEWITDNPGASIGSSIMINCIIWGNFVRFSGQVIEQQLWNMHDPLYSCIQHWDTQAGIGNINDDPLFYDTSWAGMDLKLRHDSPCIDAGMKIPGLDWAIDGAPRPIKSVEEQRGDGSGVDIGAYEFQGQ